MDLHIRSRKRKQQSDTFGGIFTRSRSQIYFHRHRSGYARPDSNRIKSFKPTAKSLVKQQQLEDTASDSNQVTSQVSVKDLRARRVFSRDDDVQSIGELDLEPDLDVQKKNDGNIHVSVSESEAGDGDLGVSGSVAVGLQPGLENVVDCSLVREKSVNEAAAAEDDVVVQMTPTAVESEQKNMHVEKDEIISVANEIADTKGLMIKNQSLVTNLRGRRKVFKSPSSFSYRRLLPYLKDLGNDDFSSFEIVDATLPKVLKSSITAPHMVACKDEEVALASNSSKLADGLLNNAKSCEKQVLDGVNDGIITTVESFDFVHKRQEDVLDDTLVCEQMTPPDSDIHSKSKIDNVLGVTVNPKLKPAFKSCSRKKVFYAPTSFSHRRLLPFLMSVAEDLSCSSKGDQFSKHEKAVEQNQQPPTHSSLDQIEKSTIADETSNSPTSTLIPVDTSIDITKSVTLNDNILDANEPIKDVSGSISQLEVTLQGEDVQSDSCIKLEQSPPKVSLKCVEEAIFKATPLCIEQSCSEDHQTIVKESPPQHLLQITETHGENVKNGILKRTPRGCRGICNCLNCTSFRLHAERSFEFSKNQLLDAEEVALELINDLSCLRNVLETTSSCSSPLDTVKEKLVKEACAKALYKEQEARARLAQMNEELSTHCRRMNSLRPKVTFANKIEEKVISKDKICGKKSV
ncbi:hypothetical protein QVD17_01092 [Tagetes erecta]|uniref:Uncharacterized protein n=1 Tax=Tagetes erecta TaxID=13708 RepID=A0AAD8P818_TARER|nr:hypothetical protein QVD17_01092 [Tagetes erecta]